MKAECEAPDSTPHARRVGFCTSVRLPILVFMLALASVTARCSSSSERSESRQGSAQSAGISGGYADSVGVVAQRRANLWHDLRQSSADDREAVMVQAEELLRVSVVQSIAPHWYGTPWDFNGTSETPGEGTIACGYFVTTVLRDIGLGVNRVELAQLPSESIIKSLVSEEHIRRFSDASLEAFVQSVQEWGAGLYVVGLDCHVGFIACDGDDVRFLHSAFAPPYCVVSEDAAESPVLGGSRYRVLGKLTSDPKLLRTWLAGESIVEADS